MERESVSFYGFKDAIFIVQGAEIRIPGLLAKRITIPFKIYFQ